MDGQERSARRAEARRLCPSVAGAHGCVHWSFSRAGYNTFHNDAAHAPLAKLDCGGKPNRTGTDYQYIGFHIDLCAHVLRRSLGRWQANVSRYRVRQEVAGADRFL
jgi:hypothetical protein